MTELPKGWAASPFQSLLEFALGGDWGKAPGEALKDSTLVRCIRASELKNWETERGKTAALRRVSYASLEKRQLQAGDLLVEISGGGPQQPVGRTVLITPVVLNTHRAVAFVCTNFFRLCRPYGTLNATFLNWYLTFFYRSGGTEELQGGSNNLRNLRFPDFLAQNVPLPPLNEQHRIVEKIEAMFEQIDKGVESLAAAKTTLGLYRQSLLKSAFEGRLTAAWRTQNPDKLETPKALLARIQKERETRYKSALDDWQTALSEWRANGEQGRKPTKPSRPREITVINEDIGQLGWASIPLGLMIDTPAYGTSKKCDYNGGVHGVLRIPNVGSGRIDATDLKSANFDEGEIEQYSLMEGDILTVRSNGSLSAVGKPAIISAKDVGYLFAGYLIRLRAIPGSLVPQYLAYLMTEPHIRGQIEEKAKSTSGINNISAKELQDLNVPVCSPAEQAEITRILDARLTAADAMEAEINAALLRAEALRQSILKQAFAGTLVPQDPTDEPAPILLARIKAERAKAGKTTRKTKA